MVGTNKTSVSLRFTALVVLAILAAALVYIPWCIARQDSYGESRALAEARTLSQEMDAVWDYVNSVQNQINYDSTGRYDFKNVYCSIAGKAVAERFMSRSDYTVRYVRESPRSRTDEPDDFEQSALASFERGDASEFYAVTEFQGAQSFRYVTVLRYEENCLECHGTPAGEPDPTGFLKEGKSLGDVAGATSIVIPMDLFQAEKEENIFTDVLFFLLLVVVIVFILRGALWLWVTRPLAQLGEAAGRIGSGQWSAPSPNPRDPHEIEALAQALAAMADQLRLSYESLEEKVTERTRDLARSNEMLEAQRTQISEALDEVERMNKVLQEEVAYKSSFLSIMSHELKTPVASILASLRIWNRTRRQTDPTDDALAEDVRLQCARLLDTIDNALGMTRLESGRFAPQITSVDIVDVLDEVEDGIRPIARQRSIEVRRSISADTPLIRSDWDSIHKIVANLASNAVKFAPEGGWVDLRAQYDRNSEHVLVSVSDNGIGIAKADQARIFERFVQLDASLSREYHGSGLGLALARELSDRIGASLTVESAPGHGSTFILSIPRQWADPKKGES